MEKFETNSLGKIFPQINITVLEYISGYIKYIAENIENNLNLNLHINEELNYIKELILQTQIDCDLEKIKNFINMTYNELTKIENEKYNNNNNSITNNSSIISNKKLSHSMIIEKQKDAISSLGLLGVSVDIDSVSRRKFETRVDKKKLEKAERKIAAKIKKRAQKAIVAKYEASKLISEKIENYDDFYMAVNPLQLGNNNGGSNEFGGKTKDIKIDNIDLYVGDGKRILTDTTLTLSYGHKYGLIGHNGVGKSTLLRALSRRELSIPTHITILHVEQELIGDDTSAIQSVLDADVWRKHLLIDQKSILEKLSILDHEREICEDKIKLSEIESERENLDDKLGNIYDKLSEIESDKAESKAASILSGLGFSRESQGNPTKSFSGGWRMRLALARALFCQPDLLLLDEPSNMLDVPSITYLANYLQSYPSTLLVVSHDRDFLDEVATDIIHMHSERLDYYRGCNFEKFYSTREERFKNQKREYENQLAYRKHLQEFIDKFRYNAAKSSEAQSRIKKLEKLPILEMPVEDSLLVFRFPDVEKISPPIIQFQNVSFGYTEDKLLLKNIDLDVQLDSRIALVGANGCGKTTLLKLLIDALKPTIGHVFKHSRLRIAYFAQHHIDGLDLSISAVSWMNKNWPGKSEEEYRRHLGAFGIKGTTGLQKMALLSGGQKSRVAFACLGLSNPHILVLDEPSNHLDTQGLDALADALNKFQGGILMVSHDVAMISRVAKEIWISENGTVTQFPGTIQDYKKRILSQANATGVVKKH